MLTVWKCKDVMPVFLAFWHFQFFKKYCFWIVFPTFTILSTVFGSVFPTVAILSVVFGSVFPTFSIFGIVLRCVLNLSVAPAVTFEISPQNLSFSFLLLGVC